MAQPKPVLAVDIGGTKILSGLISADYQILAREYSLTPAERGTEATIESIFKSIDSVLKSGRTGLAEIASISLAAAGAIDLAKGVITSSPNVGWRNLPLRRIVRERYKIKTYLTNDAKAAALCEHRLGAGQGARHLIFITVSTGIGGGIIIDNRLYTGAKGSAGEVGHMTIDTQGPRCKCGNTGCWEMLASGTAMESDMVKRIQAGGKSSLSGLPAQEITARKIEAAAREGDKLALEVVRQTAFYFGAGVVNLVNIFNPEVIVVGGGMSRMGDMLLEPARRMVRQRAFKLAAGSVRIVTAAFQDDAGILGAAIFARQGGVYEST